MIYTQVSVVVWHKFLILSLFHSLLSGIFIAPIRKGMFRSIVDEAIELLFYILCVTLELLMGVVE